MIPTPYTKLLKLFAPAFFTLILMGCAGTNPIYSPATSGWESRDAAADNPLKHQVFLIGDAGAAQTDGQDPVLGLLRKKLLLGGQNSSVIFLGDNIYPAGLPPMDDEKHRPQAEAQLKAQLDALQNYQGNISIIPGNHDWRKSRRGGVEALARQEEFVNTYLGREGIFKPANGCPGPLEVALTDDITLIVIDTEWWLHRWDKPRGNDGVCEFSNRTEFIAALQDALRRNRNKKVIVAGHHPMYTNGAHGGKFPVRDHLFPLTNVSKGLYIPLPLVGSLYPAYRKYAGSIQDPAHPEYNLLIKNLRQTFEGHNNLVYASGHEHSLQYFERDSIHYVVSGAGSKSGYLGKGNKIEFGHAAKGFTEMRYHEDGEVWMWMWEVDGGSGKVVYKRKLKGPDPKMTESERIASYQQPPADSMVTVAAGPDYAAGAMQRFFFGNQYRETWTTPVKVPFLNMRTEHGGLTPLKKGGGQQTKSLRFRGGDGKDYVVRSIQKYPAKAIPEVLRNSVAGDIVQDMISIAHPFGAVVVPPLADAAGVFHTNPQLRILPPDPKLGEYLEDYQGQLYLYEERPARNESDSPWFGSSEKIYGSPDVFLKIFKNHDNQVDQEHFLRSRLFDILIGDWDRHEDQWRWASFKTEDGKKFKAIPRDRDQVFVKFEGFLPSLANRKWGLRKFQPYGEDTRDIAGLCFNGRYVDRSFLTGLERDEWLAMAEDLKKRVTDEIIEEAFHRLPPESFDIEGERLIRTMKIRRDRLHELAERYYYVLAKEVEVVGSNKRERFEVERIDDMHTKVSVYKLSKKGKKKEKYYERTFLRSETKEIRLFGLGGKDEFRVKGEVKKGIKVRIIGGEGKDDIKDESRVSGLSKKTHVYDRKKKTELERSGETKDHTTDRDPFINNYDRRAFKYNIASPATFFGFNVDDGLFLGGGFMVRKYGFRKDPYKWQHSFVGRYAAATGAANIRYQGDFRGVIKRWDVFGQADLNSFSFVTNFFGLSNESVVPESASLDSNRVRLSQANIILGLKRVSRDQKHEFRLGLRYLQTEVEKTEGRITAENNVAGLAEEVFESHDFSGFTGRYKFTDVDNLVLPTHGFRFTLEGDWLTRTNDVVDRSFGRIRSEATFYFSINFPLQPTFAFRVGGAMNSGDFEFYQANSIGGLRNVRGMRADRFSGTSSFYQNSEVRLRFFQLRTPLVPVRVGGLAYLDIGRVWAENEESDVLHQGWGGGLWFSPLDVVVISGYYSVSDVNELFNFRFGFLF